MPTLCQYHDCRLPDNNGFVQVGNLTSSGWTLTQVNVDPQMGTGLAPQLFYLVGLEDQINLYERLLSPLDSY